MTKDIVIVKCDVHCVWVVTPPIYRAFVAEEMFTERTWIWNDIYLEEMFQIRPRSGVYPITYCLVGNPNASLIANNWRVTAGPGTVDANGVLTIP